jgi:hypothetical protein
MSSPTSSTASPGLDLGRQRERELRKRAERKQIKSREKEQRERAERVFRKMVYGKFFRKPFS